MRLRAGEAATLAVGVAIEATGGIVEGDGGGFREGGEARTGIFLGLVHDVPSFLMFFLGGYPGQSARISKEKTYETCIS